MNNLVPETNAECLHVTLARLISHVQTEVLI